MKNILPTLFLSFICLFVTAQQNRFIYLQTENKQPFYVRLDEKLLSSSASGYLILSKLQEGTYKVVVGFPKNEWPEQQVTLRVEKRDVGYLIKNYGDKGWGFINLQTQNITMSGGIVPHEEVPVLPKQTDLFSTTLANVVNDTTILEKDLVIEPPVKKPEESNAVTDQKSTEPLPFVRSVVTRKLRKTGKAGTDFVYIDKSGDQADTIRIFIPLDKIEKKGSVDSVIVADVKVPEKKDDPVQVVDSKKSEVQPAVEEKKEEPKKEEPKKEEIKNEEQKKEEVKKDESKTDEPKSDEPKKVDPPKEEVKKEEYKKYDPNEKPLYPQPDDKKFIDFDKKDTVSKMKFGMINSDCKSFASENDFFKLRKKMAAETNDENMVKVAKKIFKSKCFPTEYIKNLSALFLKDEGKYMFFDAAYPFVSDSDIFPTLESQLTDSYYINRFKAMIHK